MKVSDASTKTDRLAADWLARRDGGGWSGGDEAELQAWLQADTAHRVAFLRLQSAWDQTVRLKALRQASAGTGATGIAIEPRLRLPAPAARPWAGRLVAVAALLLVGVFAAGTWWNASVEQADYRTALGGLDTVSLSDGSRATLASDSHINVRLGRQSRRVALERGEGYFEVAKDPDRPFVVSAGSHEAVAVGTAFSVRRVGDEVRVVVTEGTVRLVAAGDAGGAGTLLPAGSVATTRGDGVLVRRQSVEEAARLVDWRSGFLAFQDTSLAAAADEFNRYNARQVAIGDDAAGALRVGGSFRWDNLDTFVGLLEAGFPVCAERQPGRIVLHSASAAACR